MDSDGVLRIQPQFSIKSRLTQGSRCNLDAQQWIRRVFGPQNSTPAVRDKLFLRISLRDEVRSPGPLAMMGDDGGDVCNVRGWSALLRDVT